MSDVMLFGVLRMPYEMAMSSELSRYQYWQRGQQAANEIESLRQRVKELDGALIKMADKCTACGKELAALKAGQGEPVAWLYKGDHVSGDTLSFMNLTHYYRKPGGDYIKGIPLYTAPAGQRPADLTIPEGWMAVPINPTPEMLEGLENGMSYDDCNNSEFEPMIAYRTMLAAAPKPEE